MSRRRSSLPLDQNTVPGGTGPLPREPGSQTRVRGTVINCDPDGHVYLVATPHGRVAMARIRSGPGDVSLIPNGTPVVVDYGLGEPYIAGVLPPEGRRSTAPAEGVTGARGHGGEDPVLAANYGVNARASDEPNDLIPGDSVLRGPGTSSIAALHGNVAILQGGRLAQVRAFGDSDTVEVVAGQHRVVTWMGESRVVNEEGKTSFIWRGGTDQLTQTGPDEEKYPIRLDVGHSGDVLNFEICNPRGQALFRFHVDANGRLEIFAAGGIDQTQLGQSEPVRVGGSRETEVRGDDVRTVGGECRSHCESGRRCTVSNNDELVVGQDRVEHVVRDRRVTVGGRATYAHRDDVAATVDGGAKLEATGDVDLKAAGLLRLQDGSQPYVRGDDFVDALERYVGATETAVNGLAAALTAVNTWVAASGSLEILPASAALHVALTTSLPHIVSRYTAAAAELRAARRRYLSTRIKGQ